SCPHRCSCRRKCPHYAPLLPFTDREQHLVAGRCVDSHYCAIPRTSCREFIELIITCATFNQRLYSLSCEPCAIIPMLSGSDRLGLSLLHLFPSNTVISKHNGT